MRKQGGRCCLNAPKIPSGGMGGTLPFPYIGPNLEPD